MERYAGRPQPPDNVNVTKGSVHIVATRGFVQFVLEDKRAAKFLDWVRETYVPDETFFSSLNHSPQLGVPGSYLGVPETDDDNYPFLVRFKNWGSLPCHGKWVRQVCVFGIGDLPLLSSRRELFANKFHANYQPLAYDCMEQLHYSRIQREVAPSDDNQNFNASEYAKFDFVRNHI